MQEQTLFLIHTSAAWLEHFCVLHGSSSQCREPLLPCTFFRPMDYWRFILLKQMAKAQKGKPCRSNTVSQPLPVSSLLISHWPRPVTWLNSRPRGLVRSISQEITAAVWILLHSGGEELGPRTQSNTLLLPHYTMLKFQTCY